MEALTKYGRLLAGLVLVVTLLPAWAAGQDKTPENKPASAAPPRGSASSSRRTA